MAITELTAIEIGRKRVRAIRAEVVDHRLTVRARLLEEIPTEITPQDPAAFGSWLGARLKAVGIPRGRAVMILPRDSVAMKNLTLPSIEDHELPEMTRLAMQQELSSDMIVDLVPLQRDETSTTVLAVCAPRVAVDHLLAIGRAAGLSVSRISVSTLGTVALVADADQTESVITLVADVSGDSVEVAAINGSGLIASRVEEVPAPGDELSMAEAVMTGMRRAWMAHRLGADHAPVSAAVLLGRRRVCEYAAQPVGQMIGIEARVLSEHSRVDSPDGQVEEFWPLIGALLEPSLKRPMTNLARPRRAPDERAARRQRWLLAAGLLLVVGMSLYTLANRDLRGLRAEAQRLATARAQGAGEYLRYRRDTYRLEHLRLWESMGVDWLGHADYLCRIAPGPDQVVLDRWTGSLVTNGVQYDKKGNKWSAPRQVTIVIDGEARDRETADTFRETLVQNSLYSTSSTGADTRGGKRMPFGFTYRLRTQGDAPTGSTAVDPAATTSKKRSDERSPAELAMSEGVPP